MENRNYRECAIEHLKQGNLCKGYVDYILGEMEKLEKIRQIVSAFSNTYGLTNVNLLSDDLTDFEKDILREILEQE
jgi:hypothetical protein